MSSLYGRWLIASLLLLTFTRATSAQEAPPATDETASAAENAAEDSNPYAALRKSKNQVIKDYADRYDDLTSLNEWTDKSGKHKVKARYLEHDPDLKWVKLETVTGSGDKRVTKEIQLTLDKLNKPSRSRVKQIAALQRKLDELSKAEEGDSATSSASPIAATEERGAYGERGERGPGRGRDRGGEGEPTKAEGPTGKSTPLNGPRATRLSERIFRWSKMKRASACSSGASSPS